jgi:hypothetical protein
MLSLVYPICNRTALFKATLQSLTQQTLPTDEFEIIVVDDGGTCPDLKPLLTSFRLHGLPIRYARIDIHRLPFTNIYQHNGLFNDPGPAWNLGIKLARGERVVLSSPECMHALRTNLDRMEVWPLDDDEGLICDVFDPSLANDPTLWGMIGGGPNQRALHFLGVYHTEMLIRLGGFEEEFVAGWGCQDSEFLYRFAAKWGYRYQFSGPAIQAVHQPHPRVENVDQTGVKIADALCARLIADPDYRVANVGREWGSRNLIVEEEWLDA